MPNFIRVISYDKVGSCVEIVKSFDDEASFCSVIIHTVIILTITLQSTMGIYSLSDIIPMKSVSLKCLITG